jgi:exopolysaccharide biosynthesis polyprenyl glycosylphosphotransferase
MKDEMELEAPPPVDGMPAEQIEPRSRIGDMIRWDSRRRRALAAADSLALLLAYGIIGLVSDPAEAFQNDRLPLLAAIPVWIVLNKLLGLYDSDANLIHKSTLNELPAIIQSLTLGVALVFVLGDTIFGVEPSRLGAGAFWLVAFVLTPVFRYTARDLVRRTIPVERCLIIGAGPVSELLARKIEANPKYGAKVVALVDLPDEDELPDPAEPSAFRHYPLPDVHEFEQLARQVDADRVLIGFSRLAAEELLEIIQTSKLLELKITVVPRLFEMIGHSVEVDQVEGMTLLGVRGFGRTRSSLFLKRLLDLTGATVGLIVLAPFLALVALSIKMTSSGPVFFRQKRIGRDNEPFTLLKFRTMVDGADALKPTLQHLNEADGIMFKIAEDPRVTRIGRHLRRTSIDELPQLINVLRGEMSLVGPRPLVEDEDDQVIGWHRARLELTPGLTGPWQVMGRTTIPFHEMIKLDYLYVAEWSLWNDIKLLIRTAPVVVLGRGA